MGGETSPEIEWPGWEVVRIIGRGSFGVVYEIQRTLLGGKVERAALKVITIPQNSSDIEELLNDGYDSESITQRFDTYLQEIVREYSFMVEMKGSTNVVYCDDLRYIQHDDGFGYDIYIKMELLTPLTKVLGPEIPEEQVIQLGIDICNALVFCKSRNVVHRDIKPQNIFVSPEGHYKLGDFGIAKTAERTTSGTKIGTYKYMAPEVYHDEPYGSAADLYSLGLVLYWMLNNRRTPFLPLDRVPSAAEEEETRKRRFRGEKIPAPLKGSEELKRIVLKACAYDPKERYASAAEMKADLEALANIAGVIPVPVVESVPGPESKPMPLKENVPEPTVGQPRKPKPEPKPESYKLQMEDNPEATEGPKALVIPPTKKKFNLLLLAAVGFLALILVLILTLILLKVVTRQSYGVWSEWSTEEPEALEGRIIETTTEFRYRDNEAITADQPKTDSEDVTYELYNQTIEWSQYGEWSEWQEEAVTEDDTREVESKTQYSSREWISSQSYSDWSGWSQWTVVPATVSDTTQVEMRTVYYYSVYRYRCSCGLVMDGIDTRWCVHWERGALGKDPGHTGLGEAVVEEVFSDVIMADLSDNEKLSKINGYPGLTLYYEEQTLTTEQPLVFGEDGSCEVGSETWYSSSQTADRSETQYRTRTRSLQNDGSFTNWTEFGDDVIEATSTREVQTRTMYRYREKEEVVTYYYLAWQHWSDWSQEKVPEADNREIQERTVYRYADRKAG